MKIKVLLNLLLIFQTTFVLLVLFFAPNLPSYLRYALKDLKSGDVSKATERVSVAIQACEFQARITLLAAFGTLILSLLLSVLIRKGDTHKQAAEKVYPARGP